MPAHLHLLTGTPNILGLLYNPRFWFLPGKYRVHSPADNPRETTTVGLNLMDRSCQLFRGVKKAKGRLIYTAYHTVMNDLQDTLAYWSLTEASLGLEH